MFTDDFHRVYAWDVVGIFSETVVTSLPALNGVLDQGTKESNVMR